MWFNILKAGKRGKQKAMAKKVVGDYLTSEVNLNDIFKVEDIIKWMKKQNNTKLTKFINENGEEDEHGIYEKLTPKQGEVGQIKKYKKEALPNSSALGQSVKVDFYKPYSFASGSTIRIDLVEIGPPREYKRVV